MKNSIALMGILVTVSLLALAPFVVNGETFAQKAEVSAGSVSSKSYGSATNDIVCGDKLCSEIKEQTDG